MPVKIHAQSAHVVVPPDALLALVVAHVAQEVDELGFARCASRLPPERPGFDLGRFRRKGFRQYYNICTSEYPRQLCQHLICA